MPRVRGGLVLPGDDDTDFIEIHDSPPSRPRNNIENLLNPQRSSSPPPPRAIRPVGRALRWDRPPQPRPTATATAFIDLTGEPDSPVEQRAPPQPGRNPRRTNSQRISPPRLARSDSTFIAPGASFIDLTVDPPDEDQQAEPPRQLRPRHHHHHHHHHHHRPGGLANDQLIELEFINGGVGLYAGLARGVRQMAGQMAAGLIGSQFMRNPFNGATLDFAASISPREPSPKPPMEEVPPCREGFTRDTCANSKDDVERVAICPACNEELAYDPSEAAMQSAPATGSRKRKRAPGEHHFWAVKKCGHVYCADCFENRRPTKAAPNGVGFRGPGGKPPSGAPNELRCAVDNCETKVAAKTEWIGIYL